MKIFNQQYQVQKLPKSGARAERLKLAMQEAEAQYNAQAQRVVEKPQSVETEPVQRVADTTPAVESVAVCGSET